MTDNDHSNINMSSIPVAGIGGLGMMVVAGIMAWVLPEARAFAVAGVAGGVVVGCALIGYRKWRTSSPAPGATLMVDGVAETATRKDHRRADSELKRLLLRPAR